MGFKLIELVFGLRVTLVDSCFVLDGVQIHNWRRETSLHRWGVGLRRFAECLCGDRWSVILALNV